MSTFHVFYFCCWGVMLACLIGWYAQYVHARLKEEKKEKQEKAAGISSKEPKHTSFPDFY